jgi:hypothetical protein
MLASPAVHAQPEPVALTYPAVHTGVTRHFSDDALIDPPQSGDPFYGQDPDYPHHQPSYTDHGDGTITDNVTGLMWQKTMGPKISFKQAREQAADLRLAGHIDWRVPTIKELYSLILFTGVVNGHRAVTPFIDTQHFDQPFGNPRLNEREIDAQTWSATRYVGRTMRDDRTVFGVNFIDGRIKGYPEFNPRTRRPNRMYVRYVRGAPDYGQNRFVDHGDGTITDQATGLMWQRADSARGMDWGAALRYAQDLELAGHDDWRLPNAKELHSIVRSRIPTAAGGTLTTGRARRTRTAATPTTTRRTSRSARPRASWDGASSTPTAPGPSAATPRAAPGRGTRATTDRRATSSTFTTWCGR